MRFIEFIAEGKQASLLSEDTRARLKRAQDADIARVRAEKKKKEEFDASPEGQAKKAKGLEIRKKHEEDQAKLNTEVNARNKVFMKNFKAKGASTSDDTMGDSYAGRKKGSNWTGD